MPVNAHFEHLEHMKELQAKGNTDCGPSVVTYNTVISALTASKSEDALEKAFILLREAHESADMGNRNVQPNTRTYSTLSEGYCVESATQ